MRLGDRERDELAELLSRHSAEGRLDPAEFERRISALYAAESRDQISPLIADLPPLEPQRRRRGLAWGRGHAEADRPEIGWVATDERFRDPQTERILRVWVDPQTGTRHYVPDERDASAN